MPSWWRIAGGRSLLHGVLTRAAPKGNRARSGHGMGGGPSIYTLPEVWGAGVGKALMAEVVDSLAQAGYVEATLWVLEGNDRAQDFYRGQGWSKDGSMIEDRSDGFLITKVRYRRPLPI